MLQPTPIQVAADLLSIHHHDEATGEIYYKEAELLPILEKWGHVPDWEGNAKAHEAMVKIMRQAFLDLHPGNLIAECIETSRLDPETTARRLGVTVKYLDEILYRGGPISARLAKRLEGLFGKPAFEWLDMQDEYLTAFNKAFTTTTQE